MLEILFMEDKVASLFMTLVCFIYQQAAQFYFPGEYRRTTDKYANSGASVLLAYPRKCGGPVWTAKFIGLWMAGTSIMATLVMLVHLCHLLVQILLCECQ